MSVSLRGIKKIWTPQSQAEGDGATVRRIIGSSAVRNLDPFLMMDHFIVHKPNGFPDHPHRGFETVTYMISGSCKHEDFKGHFGEIEAGDTQWMTAGRGIVHAEMPGTDVMEGLQLWVNLKASDKMCNPAYQEKRNADIPKALAEGVEVTIIAGESLGVTAQTQTRTPALYIDVKIQAGARFVQNIENGWNAYIYVIDGKIRADGKEIKGNQAALLDSNGTSIEIIGVEKSRFALLAGRPIGEKIVQYGPFVMNENHEINEAMQDYHMARNGFEGARNWSSKIARDH